MRIRLNPEETADAKGEDEEFICHECNKFCSEGFICENRNGEMENGEPTYPFYCEDCQDLQTMTHCRHDKRGEHKHIKVIRAR